MRSRKALSPPPTPANELQAFYLDKRHFSMVRQWHLADLITLMNGFCGVMSVFASLHYAHTGQRAAYVRSLLLVPLGLVFDFLDGRVARLRNKSSLLGQELDSLADLISFGVAPASIGFVSGLETPVDTLVLAVFVLCGLTRLARFNVSVNSIPHDAKGKARYFEGAPIPTSLCLVALHALCYARGALQNSLPLGLALRHSALRFHPFVLIYLAWGCAMVSKSLKVPKL